MTIFLKLAKTETQSIGDSNTDDAFEFKLAEYKTTTQLLDIIVKLI